MKDVAARQEEFDIQMMREALLLAAEAASWGDVPVGAVVVHNGEIIGRGANLRVRDGDPLAHAEVVALREAAASLGAWRLDDTTLYVTLEPCPMCAGAIVQARVQRVVFGAFDAKMGAARSRYQICDDPRLYHKAAVVGGVLHDECVAVLHDFFEAARARNAGLR